MKILLSICTMFFTISSFAGVLAVCHSSDTQQTITAIRDNNPTATWDSITLEWNRKDGANSFRQFVNKEISQNNAKKLVLSQNNMFLGMGQKTTFTLNKKNGTASLTGKVGSNGGVGAEPSGRININFDSCEIQE